MRALFKGQFTIMLAYDGPTDGESHTIALPETLGREEGIENAIAYRGRNTGARIFE